METIRFYDFSFNPIWDLQKVISVNWILYYNDIGTFELHVDIQDGLTGVLQAHPYLVAVQGEKQAIITGRRLEGRECILYGRTCNWLLTRRVTSKFEAQSGNAEELCRSFVAEAFLDVSEIVLGGLTELEEEVEVEQTSDCTTFDIVQSTLDKIGAGHEICFRPRDKQWVFAVLMGKTQMLTLSEDNRNAYDSSYTEDFLDYYTGGWYEAEQTEATAESTSERIRTYVSGNEEQTGIYRWECILTANTEEAAKEELSDRKWQKDITAKLREVRFGVDYCLGDSLRFKAKFGRYVMSDVKQVDGIHIWYEEQECGEEPILV